LDDHGTKNESKIELDLDLLVVVWICKSSVSCLQA